MCSSDLQTNHAGDTFVLQLNILWVYLAMSTEQLVKCIAGVVRLRTGKWIHDLTRPQTIE